MTAELAVDLRDASGIHWNYTTRFLTALPEVDCRGCVSYYACSTLLTAWRCESPDPTRPGVKKRPDLDSSYS